MEVNLTTRLLLLGYVVATFAAGCTSPPPARIAGIGDDVRVFDGRYSWPPLVAHDAQGRLLSHHDWLEEDRQPRAIQQMIPRFSLRIQEYDLWANLVVSKQGGLFALAAEKVLKSSDHGRSWSVTHNLQGGPFPHIDSYHSAGNASAVDPASGRLFLHHVLDRQDLSACGYFAYSDDEGKTWTLPEESNGLRSCLNFYVGAQPNMTVSQGVLYLCSTYENSYECRTSQDSGNTFSLPKSVPSCALPRPPVAFPDGGVGIATQGCARVTETKDGVTWTKHDLQLPEFNAQIQPALAVARDGTAYFAYQASSTSIQFVRSVDRFQTWQGPYQVSAPDLDNVSQVAIAAGDDGRIAVAYYGIQKQPGAKWYRQLWHLYVTYGVDANTDTPTFVTQRVTPTQDPVGIGDHDGPPWPPTMSVDPDGRFIAAFFDHCTPRIDCPGDTDAARMSWDRQLAVAVLDAGPSLYPTKGFLPSLGLQPPMPYPPKGQ